MDIVAVGLALLLGLVVGAVATAGWAGRAAGRELRDTLVQRLYEEGPWWRPVQPFEQPLPSRDDAEALARRVLRTDTEPWSAAAVWADGPLRPPPDRD